MTYFKELKSSSLNLQTIAIKGFREVFNYGLM